MINRRQYYKANDQKVLHKVHKRWIVVSLALLGALGLGQVALGAMPTHAASVNNAGATATQNVSRGQSTAAARPAATGGASAPTANTGASAQHTATPQTTGAVHTGIAQPVAHPAARAQQPATAAQPVRTATAGVGDTRAAGGYGTSTVGRAVSPAAQNRGAVSQQPVQNASAVRRNPVVHPQVDSKADAMATAIHNNNVASSNSMASVPRANVQASQVASSSISAMSHAASMASQRTIRFSISASASSSAAHSQSASLSGMSHQLRATNTDESAQLKQQSAVQHRQDAAAKTALAKNSWGNLKNRGLNLNESENMRSNNMLNRQKQLSKVLQQNAWTGNPQNDLDMSKMADPDEPDVGYDNNPAINVDGDKVTYDGNAELHFFNNQNQDVKDLSVPYNTTAAVGDTATILDPNDFLNKNIQGFNTTGYHAVGDSPITKTVSPDDIPNGAAQAVITNNYSYNYMTDTPSQPTLYTDVVNYVCNGGNVGKTTVSGQPGAQVTVTGTGLDNGYQLSGDGTQSFALDNGSHNVDAVLSSNANGGNVNGGGTTPSTPNGSGTNSNNKTDVIYYIFDGNNEGSTTITGPAGTKIVVNGSGMPKGFHLAGNALVPIDGNDHSVDVLPSSDNSGGGSNNNNNIVPNGNVINNNDGGGSNGGGSSNGNNGGAVSPLIDPNNQNDTDQINYTYNGAVKGSTIMRGRNGVTTSADGNGMPTGFKLANDGTQSFIFDNGTHSVDVVPLNGSGTNAEQDNDTLNFLYNGVLKGSTTKHGTDKMTGIVQRGDIPNGYELAPNASNTFTFDNGIHNIAVIPVPAAQPNNGNGSRNNGNGNNNSNANNVTPSGQDAIVITYVNTNSGQVVDHTAVTGTPGSAFNAQQYSGMAPQGYQFQRIVNPITTFGKGSQTMWIYVIPASASASNSNSNSNNNNPASNNGNNANNSANNSNNSNNGTGNNSRIPNGSFNNDVINGNGSHDNNNGPEDNMHTKGNAQNGNSSANAVNNSNKAKQPTNSGTNSTINSLASSAGNSSDNSELNNENFVPGTNITPYNDFQLTPSENRNHSYLEGYQDAVNHHRINPSDYGYDANAYDDGFDDGVSHLLRERRRGAATSNNVTGTNNTGTTRSAAPVGTGYGYGATGVATGGGNIGGDVGNVISSIGAAAQGDVDDETASSNTDESGAPEPGSVYDGYVVYQDEIGIYVLVNGVKIYWDPQTQNFDLVWSSSQNTLIPYSQVFGTNSPV